MAVSQSARRGWFVAVLTMAFGGGIAYEFAIDGRWFGMVIFGIVLPLTALADWYIARRWSADPQQAADRVLLAFVIALLGYLMLLDNHQSREKKLEAQCVQRIEAASESAL